MAKLCDPRGYGGESVMIEIKVNEESECKEAGGRWDGLNIDATHVKGAPGVLWRFGGRPRGLGNWGNSG